MYPIQTLESHGPRLDVVSSRWRLYQARISSVNRFRDMAYAHLVYKQESKEQNSSEDKLDPEEPSPAIDRVRNDRSGNTQ